MPVTDIILDQMTSSSYFSRCHVTCRFNTISDWKNCIQSTQISKTRGGYYSINCMVSAYNITTKDTRVYMETDRLPEQTLRYFFEDCQAELVDIRSFGLDWELQSIQMLHDVQVQGSNPGYILLQRGGPPKAVVVAQIPQAIHSSEVKGIYVLRLDNRPRPFFYVGKAENIEKRIMQHQNGTGAYCITGEPFTRVDPVTKGSTENLGSWERDEVLARMYEFGIDNVRGWMYTLKTMSLEKKLSAFDLICDSYDLCRKCGRGTHFIRECGAVSTDRWTGGMEIRSKYNELSSMYQQTTSELDDAIAERRRAEAALAVERRQSEAASAIAVEERRIAVAALEDAGLRIAEAARALGGQLQH